MLAMIARSARRHPTLWALLALTAPVALFYLPLLLGTHTFPDGDFTHHFLPFSLFRAEAIRTLHLPLWNPATYSGHPFLADTQAAVFYPVSALLEVLTGFWQEASARLYWLQIEAILETALAGGFVYLLARGLRLARWAAILGGLAFALSGYLTSYPPLQLAVLRTAIWLPCLLWLLLRTAQSPRQWHYPLALAAATAITLSAGHPQTWLHVAYAAGAWTLFLAAHTLRAGGYRRALALLGTAGMAVLAGQLLGAVQLLPSIEFQQLSVRASVDYAFVSGGFPVQDSWQLLLPGVLTVWSPLYVGAPALLLAIAALVLPQKPTQPGAVEMPSLRATSWFFAGMNVLALLVAFGENGFLYPLVYRVLPGWNLFRGQERAALLVALALSVLAAVGAQALAATPAHTRRRFLVSALVAATCAVAAYLFGWQLAGHSAVDLTRFMWIAASVGALLLGMVLLAWAPGWSPLRAGGTVTLVLVALFAANSGVNLEAVTPAQRTTVAPELIALQDAVHQSENEQNATTRVYNEYRAYEDYAMRLEVEDLWGSSPLRLARYTQFNQSFPLDRWWSLTGVSHVLTWRKELFVSSRLLAEYPQTTDTTYLHALDQPNPRAWFVTKSTVADDATALTLLADHTFDLARTVILPPESGAQGTDTQDALPAETTVTVTRRSAESLQLRFTAPVDGLLVVSENWMPGWQVQSSGIGADDSTPVLGLPAFAPQRANLAFLAIPVPAGTHDLMLTYAPQSVQTGLWISSVTLLLLGAVVLWRLFVPSAGRTP